ncbi:MAG: hypothetical protein RLZZ531_746 [Bacteroidota bacterium]|jgi:hypothetical protein
MKTFLVTLFFVFCGISCQTNAQYLKTKDGHNYQPFGPVIMVDTFVCFVENLNEPTYIFSVNQISRIDAECDPRYLTPSKLERFHQKYIRGEVKLICLYVFTIFGGFIYEPNYRTEGILNKIYLDYKRMLHPKT